MDGGVLSNWAVEYVTFPNKFDRVVRVFPLAVRVFLLA